MRETDLVFDAFFGLGHDGAKSQQCLGDSEAFSQPRFFDYSRPLSLQTSDISHLCLAAPDHYPFFLTIVMASESSNTQFLYIVADNFSSVFVT